MIAQVENLLPKPIRTPYRSEKKLVKSKVV
jgi:hypothetical protein